MHCEHMYWSIGTEGFLYIYILFHSFKDNSGEEQMAKFSQHLFSLAKLRC